MIFFIMEGNNMFSFLNTLFRFFIRLNWTFELLLLTVGKLHIVVIVWFIMTLCTSCVVFYGTFLWTINRKFDEIYLSKIKSYIENKKTT